MLRNTSQMQTVSCMKQITSLIAILEFGILQNTRAMQGLAFTTQSTSQMPA